MREADLSRPVVEVKDFLTNTTEYEIYTFSDQVIVVPIQSRERSPTAGKRFSQRPFERRRGAENQSSEGMIAGIAEDYKIPTRVGFSNKWVVITVDPVFSSKKLKFYADDRPLFLASTDSEGTISIRKGTPTGEKLIAALKGNATIYATMGE
jgi:predicted PilT family ATPase